MVGPDVVDSGTDVAAVRVMKPVGNLAGFQQLLVESQRLFTSVGLDDDLDPYGFRRCENDLAIRSGRDGLGDSQIVVLVELSLQLVGAGQHEMLLPWP